jgi:hypothetical protein
VITGEYDLIKLKNDSGFVGLGSAYSTDSGATVTFLRNDGSVKWSKICHDTVSMHLWSWCGIDLPDSTLLINILGFINGNILMKLDYSGNMISTFHYPSTNTMRYMRIVNNAVYAVGNAGPYPSQGLFCKLDSSGSLLWARKMNAGANRIMSLACFTPTPDGGFLLVGNRSIVSSNLPKALVLLKTDSIGNILWQRQIDAPNIHLDPERVSLTADSGFIILSNEALDYKSQLLRCDSLGNVLWYVDFRDGSGARITLDNIDTAGNNEYVSYGYINNITLDHYLLRLDDSGNIIRCKYFDTDTVYTRVFHFDSETGLFGWGLLMSPYRKGFFALAIDSAWNSSCPSHDSTLIRFSNTSGDSTFSITSDPWTIAMNEISYVMISDFPLQESDYCQPLSLEENYESGGFSLYPVPAKDYVMLNIEGDNNEMNLLVLYDLTGKEIRKDQFTGKQFSILKADLHAGIYFFSLQSNDKVYRGKFIFE